MLAPGTTVDDINLINVHANGTFQGNSDFSRPDDSELSQHPQLVNTVAAAKQTIIQITSP